MRTISIGWRVALEQPPTNDCAGDSIPGPAQSRSESEALIPMQATPLMDQRLGGASLPVPGRHQCAPLIPLQVLILITIAMGQTPRADRAPRSQEYTLWILDK